MSKLYYRYGAMNCGKTTALLQVANNYEERGMKVVILKPSIDTKGDNKIELTESESLVYNAVKDGVTKVDDLCLKLNLKIFTLMPIISSLEIKGVITKGTASEYLPVK